MSKQSNFENNIQMESELYHDGIPFNMDNLSDGYSNILDIIHDINDTEIINRKKLITFINYKFSKLTDTQRLIAEYKYYYGYTIKKIAKIMCKDNTTIRYHLDKIRQIW